jgi:hypothetical protein
MEIFLSVDGVLRNTIQKFEYHYNNYYLLEEPPNDSEFAYSITSPIKNDNLLNHFSFQSIEEYENFIFIEFAIEIFGHAGLSYKDTISQLNELIYKNKEHNFTVIGLDEYGKAKPSTLFFLSKNGFLGNHIRFINSNQIEDCWKQCDMWITDSKKIIDLCPSDKIAVKFNTSYNEYFTNRYEINKLVEIQNIWSKSLENPITSTSME